MRFDDFTEARATKWAKVIKLPRRDALAATPSLNNNIVYRIYCLFDNNGNNNVPTVAPKREIFARSDNNDNNAAA